MGEELPTMEKKRVVIVVGVEGAVEKVVMKARVSLGN